MIYLVFDDGSLDLRGMSPTDNFYMAIKTNKSQEEVQQIIDDYKEINSDDYNNVDLEELLEEKGIKILGAGTDFEIVYF